MEIHQRSTLPWKKKGTPDRNAPLFRSIWQKLYVTGTTDTAFSPLKKAMKLLRNSSDTPIYPHFHRVIHIEYVELNIT